MIICPNCGYENVNDAEYCTKCGIYLSSDMDFEDSTVGKQVRTVEATVEDGEESNNNDNDDWCCCACIIAVFVFFAFYALANF